MTRIYHVLILLSTALLFSCNKEEPIEPAPTMEELLAGRDEMGKEWLLALFRVIPPGSQVLQEIDIECWGDNVFTFYNTSEQAYALVEAGEPCEEEDVYLYRDEVESGAWAFTDDYEVLSITCTRFTDWGFFSASGWPFTTRVISMEEEFMELEMELIYYDIRAIYKMEFLPKAVVDEMNMNM